MRSSWKLGRFAGIDVFVHWTFLLLLGWIGYQNALGGRGLAGAIHGIGFILAIFTCVVLHEFGHALTARRFGIRTRDITLLPIGGLARLERLPEDPLQEFLVAIAGPAVNVVLAALMFVTIFLFDGIEGIGQVAIVGGDFFLSLMAVNIVLVVFNLIPAFPMDGGRIFRALLASFLDYVTATRVAARVGQLIAVAFALWGLLDGGPILVLIAVFVFFAAETEMRGVALRRQLHGATVREMMVTRFRTLAPDAPLQVAVEELLAGSQHDFPVVERVDGHDRVLGMLMRADLLRAVGEGRGDCRVGDVTRRDCGPIDESSSVRETCERMGRERCSALPVVRAGELVGIVTADNLDEWLRTRGSVARGAGPAPSRQEHPS